MNPVTFRCKRSGNVVSFTLPADIAGLRLHEGYEEVKEIKHEEEIKEATKEVLKKRGRPAKVKT